MYFQGRRVMEPCDSIQGSQPLSRYGDRRVTVLPSVLPVVSLQRYRVGFTDLSRLLGRDRSRHGQCYLPDKEFRSLCYPFASKRSNGDRTFLPASVCRHTVRTISYPTRIGFWRTVSEDSRSCFESFLLIICTRRIVTPILRSAGFTDVPAYGQILLRQRIHLRTVIVTAAVYWGFPSKRCLAANSSG